MLVGLSAYRGSHPLARSSSRGCHRVCLCLGLAQPSGAALLALLLTVYGSIGSCAVLSAFVLCVRGSHPLSSFTRLKVAVSNPVRSSVRCRSRRNASRCFAVSGGAFITPPLLSRRVAVSRVRLLHRHARDVKESNEITISDSVGFFNDENARGFTRFPASSFLDRQIPPDADDVGHLAFGQVAFGIRALTVNSARAAFPHPHDLQ